VIDRDIIATNYENAKKMYAAFGVDTDAVIERFKTLSVSVHCWQGDDIAGFEASDAASQNIVTGNYPGKARNPAELRRDMETALSMSPGAHKVNLHSIYAEPKKPETRDALTPEAFEGWIKWAKENGVGLDFNGSFFAHSMMKDGLSLSSPDKSVRDFWIRHAKACRKISAEMGKALGTTCVDNLWIPDGLKDTPASRTTFREYLVDSLDQIFEEKYDKKHTIDTLESKIFHIGAESFMTGSHEFYMGYALKNGVGICLDSGHFHPTEYIADKLSAIALFTDDILLHVSRGVHWDSDHVVIYNDELTNIMAELRRNELFGKVHIGLDYFDASLNRVGAWVIGIRATKRALLAALLEPTHLLVKAETEWNLTERLALMEEFKALPSAAVWDYACASAGIPVGSEWLQVLRKYEAEVQSKR